MSFMIEREFGHGSNSAPGGILKICARTPKADLLVLHSHRIIIIINDTTPSFAKYLGF
jgi:hypothetical protein